jgi:hypothetical protein
MQLLFNHPQIHYLIYFFVGLNLLYFIGHFIYNAIYSTKQTNSLEIFTKLTFGSLIILIASSVYWTKGNTIFLGLIFPIYFLMRGNTIRPSFELPTLKQIGYLNLIATPIIICQLILYSNCGEWSLLPIDVNNHAELSFFFKQGFESKYAALNSLDALNVPTKSPYHYCDSWLTTFFHTIFPKTYIGYTIMFVVYPILFTILLSGIMSILNSLKINTFTALLFSLLLLFLGPIDMDFTRKIFDTGNLLTSNTVIFENAGFFFNTLAFSYHGQKHIPFYILACWIVIMFMKSKEQKAIYLLGFAPLINIGLAPGIAGGLGLYSLYKIWKSKEIFPTLHQALPAFFSTLFLIVFYKINGGYDIEHQTVINTFSSNLNIKGEFLKIVLKIGYALIFLCLIYFINLLLFISEKRSLISKPLSLLVLFTILSGLLTRIIFEGFNTPQFLSYILPFVNIYLIYVFSVNYRSNLKSKISLVLILIICINNFCQTYFHATTRREISISKIHAEDFIKKTNVLLATTSNPKFGYLLSDNDYKMIPPGFWYGYYPCEFLLTRDCFQFYSLNFPNQHYAKNSQQSNNFSPNHLRYIFPHSMSRKEYENAVIKFINKSQIDFVLVKQKTTIPFSIRKIIKDSLVDSKTGDRILFVKS